MKKSVLFLSLILLCSTFMFTSCSQDDDFDVPQQERSIRPIDTSGETGQVIATR